MASTHRGDKERGTAETLAAREREVTGREQSAARREEMMHVREELMRAWEHAAEARKAQDRVLADLKEANEKLILAALRSQELAEAADSARRQLERSTEELRVVAGFRERLIGIIGHDLRNPLSAIKLSTQHFAQLYQQDPEAVRFAERLQHSVDRMANMIAQLLDFTRAHVGGGLLVVPRPIDLKELCLRIVDELELATSARVRFQCRFDGDLSGSWDPDRLAQVLSNLGSNAIAHGAPDRPIDITMRDGADEVVIEMHNSGEPIAPELLPFIFDPFRRGAEREATGGLGLGLYISDQIVRAHGGSLTVRSTRAEGTTFSIHLPRRPAAPRATQ